MGHIRMIILQGPPCSGKTTWAREFVAGKKDWCIVSKDELRHACGDYWAPRREKVIDATEKTLIEECFRNGMSVVIDGTNLDPARIADIRELGDRIEAEVEIRKFKVSFREAVRRDGNPDRRHHLGEAVIRDFFQRHFPEELEGQDDDQADTTEDLGSGTVTITDASGAEIVNLSEKSLSDLRKLAALRYTLSEIAIMLGVSVSALRLRMTDNTSPEYLAYTAGCLDSEIVYRDRVRIEAERGEEWAIKMLEKWKVSQLSDQLGCHV